MERRQCTATSRQSGQRCKRVPVPGAEVCVFHGGGAPQVRAAAERRLAAEEARKAVVTYGLPIEVDPGEALLQEIYRTAGHVAWLEALVHDLPKEELTWGVGEEAEKGATEFPGTDTTRKAAPNVWLLLYRDERKHLHDVCKTALQIGLEERQVQLAERQGALLAEVIRSVIDDPSLALSADQRRAAGKAAAHHLRLIAS